ncbi:MAG: spherulation-specific family 4 protein [Proteobacteria bacterium]|nr:spherulation-specific family 4 protein [Pseudomonadota bacterium]MBS0494656.1 spherulation-specific family 4 protein [Pseudomonadota bacterium]
MHCRSRHTAAILFSLTMTLAGCGGGSSQGSASSPSPSSAAPGIEVVFTAPAEADNVHTVNTPVALQLGVTAGGTAAPDNTAISLSGANASFAPVQPLTHGGLALSTLSATQVGELQLQARPAATQDMSGGATRTLYIRPQPRPLELLVPAYFSPGPGSDWDVLASGAQGFPAVSITAILNPGNGIFTKEDPLVTAAITAFRQNGGKVLGYVYTRYGRGTRSVADIQRNIDNYRQVYGAQIDGFFLDEMDATGKQLDFYRQIFQYIKGLDSRLRVVGNPGTYSVSDYANVADALVTFEGQAAAYRSASPQPANTWVYRLVNSAQVALVHDATSCAAMQDTLRSANTPQRNTGLVYATDLHYDYASNTGNPWAALPRYWPQLLATVDAINKGRALPSC